MTKQWMADYTKGGGQIYAPVLTDDELTAVKELAAENLVRFDGLYWLAPKRVRQAANRR